MIFWLMCPIQPRVYIDTEEITRLQFAVKHKYHGKMELA